MELSSIKRTHPLFERKEGKVKRSNPGELIVSRCLENGLSKILDCFLDRKVYFRSFLFYFLSNTALRGDNCASPKLDFTK